MLVLLICESWRLTVAAIGIIFTTWCRRSILRLEMYAHIVVLDLLRGVLAMRVMLGYVK